MTQISRRRLLGAGIVSLGAVGAAGASASRVAAQDGPQARRVHGLPPNTRFAVNVEMWWRSLPFLDRIRKAASVGFLAVELWELEGKDTAAIAALHEELGIDVAQFTAWGFRPPLNDPANHDRFEERIREVCGIARQMGVKHATVVGGDDQPGMTREQMHANITDALRRVAPIAEDNDLTLVLEPMNVRVDHRGHCLWGSAPALAITRAVGSSHVRINWDLYHMQISEGDLCGHLAEGIDQIGYVQLADHPGRHEPGTGEIAYARVLQELKALGYDGYVGLECTPLENEARAALRVIAVDQW